MPAFFQDLRQVAQSGLQHARFGQERNIIEEAYSWGFRYRRQRRITEHKGFAILFVCLSVPGWVALHISLVIIVYIVL